MKRILAFLVGAIMCISFVGCADKKNNSPEVEPGPDFFPLTEIKDGRKNIYLIVKTLANNNYWEVLMDGAKDSADFLDCNVYVSGSYAESDWKTQERLLGDAISANADGVVIAPDDSVNLAGKIDEVYLAGIPVVLIDTTANTDNYDICYMTDNLMAGQKAADEMIKQLKNNGVSDSENIQIGIQVGQASSQTVIERLAGFLQFWSKHAPDSWEILHDIRCSNGIPETALEYAEDILENPQVKGVFTTNSGPTVGFAKALKNNNRTDVVFVGFDYSDEMADIVNDKDYHASTILQRQYDMGYTGVESALGLSDGISVDNKFIDMGVVNKDTINQADIQEILQHN